MKQRKQLRRTAEKAPPAKPEKADTLGRLEANRIEAQRVLGLADRTFARLEAEGVIVPSQRGRGGRASVYAIEQIVPAYLAYVLKQRPANDRDARSRRDESQAALNELRLQRERGALVSREQVLREGQTFAKGLSAMIRSLPRQLTQNGIIRRDDEPAAAQQCRRILDEISRWKTIEEILQSAERAEGDAA